MGTLVQDLRYAVRVLAKRPASTAVVVLSLAIGIGANSAIFSVVDALLLEPLPYAAADRLVIMWQRSPGLGVAEDWFSPAQYHDVKTQSTAFDESAIAISASFNMTSHGEPERVDAAKVSSSFFPLVGARAMLGRVFAPEEDEPGRAPVVILANDFWRRRFGADPGVLGQTVTLNGNPFTVVGVMPPEFTLDKEILVAVYGIRNADLLLPLPLEAGGSTDRDREDYNIYARLRPGVTLAQAQSELDVIAARMRDDYPEHYPPNGGLTVSAVPLLEQVVGDVRPALYVLFGAVGFVLLAACANVANLLLARAAARQKEIAVRSAVGASRARVVRQLLTESLLLAVAGGVAGLGVAVAGIAVLRVVGAGTLPRIAHVALDARVVAFTLVVSLATGVLFGLVPALRTSRVDLNDALKDGSRTSSGAGHDRIRRLLIVSEVALSLLLLVGAALLVRSYHRVSSADPGFDAHNVLSMRLSLPAQTYSSPEPVTAYYRELGRRVAALPGVESVGTNFLLPMSSSSLGWGPVTVEGYVPRDPHEIVISNERFISPEYLQTMRIPLVEGRHFTDGDVKDAPAVALVNEAFAHRFWPGESPLGKRIERGKTGLWRTVVGVVHDAKEYAPDDEPDITVYHPMDQICPNSRYLVVRTTGDPVAAVAAIVREVHALDPDLPVYDVATMDRRVSDSLARRRFSMLLLGVLAAVAVVLAVVGIYGVLAYAVNQRTREIGIRMALGAGRRDIVRLVVGQAVAMVALGIAAGLVGALALTRVMQSLLFGVSATDAATFVAVPLALAAVALVATYVPTRRATRVDPLVALRHE